MNNETSKIDPFLSRPVKPIDTVIKIINHFSDVAQPLLGRHGDDTVNFHIENHGYIVIYLSEGRIDAWRNHDQLLVTTAVAPAIIGLQGSEFRYLTHTFQVQPKSEIYYLMHDTALDIIREKDLISDVLLYQSYMNDQQTYRDFLMINSSSYEIICMLLTELSRHPHHAEISIEKYILERTRMARSGVMKILSDLRFGGFIEVKKGKLIRLCSPFPKGY